MRASTLLLVIGLAGCNSNGVSKLVDNAVLAAVSPDEKFIAYYTNYTLMSDKAAVGTLTVQPISGGAPTGLGEMAFGAGYDRNGAALFYGSGPVASTDAGATNTVYGALNVWTAQTTGGIKLTAGLATYSVTPPDGSFALVFDGAMPTRTQSGNVILARTADCVAAACKPIMLATGVVVSSMVASEDGRFAAYVVVNSAGARPTHEAWLVNVGAGTASLVASSGTFNFAALSPDGNLLATATTAMQAGGLPVPLPLQLQVYSTSTGKTVPWAAQPMGTGTSQAAFADAQTLITRAVTIGGGGMVTGSIYKSTASAATQIVPSAKLFILQRNTAAAARWLFVSVNAAANTPPYDLALYDLQAATPAAVQLATAGAAPLVSDDGTLVRYFENYDATSQTGSLELATLASAATPAKIADGITLNTAGFADQGHSLFYLDAPGGAGTLFEVAAGAAPGAPPVAVAKNVFNSRSRAMPNPTLYFAVTAADPVTGAATPGIYSKALH